MNKRCLNCMREYGEAYEVCPHCGFIEGTPSAQHYYLSPGEILNRKYIVGTVENSGGFGIVYRAWDASTERLVAIKEYFPLHLVSRNPGERKAVLYSSKNEDDFWRGIRRYLTEAQNMAEFSQPDIVTVYDYFKENDTAYIVMEYLDGLSLRDYMEKKGGVLPCEEACAVMGHVLEALCEVHSHGIIHRDISPDNIFLCSEGRVKLIDFGAANLASGTREIRYSTVVKEGYVPPEQYQTRGRQGPYTDLYAVGACLYHLVTGIKPQASLDRAMQDELVEPKALRPDIPEALNRTILQALSLEPEARFQSAKEFLYALRSEREADAPELPGKKMPKKEVERPEKTKGKTREKVREEQPPKKSRRKSRLLPVLASLFVALLLCGGLFYGITHHTRLVDLGYEGEIFFYVPESQEDYYAQIVNDYGIDHDSTITVRAVADADYKKTVQEHFSSEEAVGLFVSDDFSEGELSEAENIERYVAEKLEDAEGDFYGLSDYYEKGGEKQKLPTTLNVPLLVENVKVGAMLTAPVASGAQLVTKKTKKKAKAYVTKESVAPLAENLALDSENTKKDAQALRQFQKGNTAFYVTDWADYHKLLKKQKMDLTVAYPNESVSMRAELGDFVSISDELPVQAKLQAEKFVLFLLESQADYLTEEERPDRLPLNWKAFHEFAQTWTLNLASDAEEGEDGSQQFEAYVKRCKIAK